MQAMALAENTVFLGVEVKEPNLENFGVFFCYTLRTGVAEFALTVRGSQTRQG